MNAIIGNAVIKSGYINLGRQGLFRISPCLLAAAFSIFFYFCLPQAKATLAYNKYAIAQGEYWRFLSGHWVHYNFAHFFWDTLDFFVFGAVVCYRSPRLFMVCTLGSAFAISFYTWIKGSPAIFLGLSGIHHALFATLTFDFFFYFLKRKDYGTSALFALLFVSAIPTVLWQTWFDKSFFTPLGLTSHVYVAAHFVGIFWGSGLILVREGLRAFKQRQTHGHPDTCQNKH